MLLKFRHDGSLFSFAFSFNLRRYIQAGALLAEAADRALTQEVGPRASTRSLFGST
jgi:hypothetical protein